MAFMRGVQVEFMATSESDPSESLRVEISSEVEQLEIRESTVRFRVMGEFGIWVAPLAVFEKSTFQIPSRNF
jgi:hypothetical protein